MQSGHRWSDSKSFAFPCRKLVPVRDAGIKQRCTEWSGALFNRSVTAKSENQFLLGVRNKECQPFVQVPQLANVEQASCT